MIRTPQFVKLTLDTPADEEKYRALFERMNEAFCVIEMIFDEAGRPVDYIHLETNPAFVKHTGQPMVGRRVREVMPDFEQFWIDQYGHVAITGEPVRVENVVAELGQQWFQASVFRLGGEGSRRVAVLFTNVTERKRQEERLRHAAEADAFRVALTDALRPLADPVEVQAAAVRVLREHLGASRALYFETEPGEGGGHYVIRCDDCAPGVPSLAGRHRIGDFGAEVASALRAGRTVTVTDIQHEPTLSEAERAAYRTVQIGAHVVVPLIKNGQYVASVAVQQTAPRAWTPGEVSLVEETAERTWAAVERARAEAAVHRSEELLRALIDNLPDGAAFIVDHDQRYLLAGGPALQAAGFEPGYFVGKTLAEALGDARAALRGDPFSREHDGHGRSYSSRGVPLRAADGHVYAALAVPYDVTARRQAEAALEATRGELRLVVENALEHAIISLDLERRIRTWNPGAEKMFGFAAAEMVGQSMDQIFTPKDRANGVPEKEASKVLREGRGVDERWHPRRSGSLFWGSCVMLPMTARSGGEPIGFVKIMRDETPALENRQALAQSRLSLEDALRDAEAARAEAEGANQSKDRFLAVLSHELRTPLTPVLMGAHLLGRARSLTESQRETLDMITRNVQLEVRLIDDLLDLTRVDRGKLELAREPVDLHEIVRRAVEVVQADFASKAQRVAVALDAPEHRLTGDATRLQQVVWNLLKNAAKFTPEGGTATVRTRAGEQAGWVALEVTDTGIGMEAEVLERIFQPFEQANQDITRQFGGLGLGLAISKAVVDGHGGTLAAASPGRGRGVTFTVRLPVGGKAAG